MLVDTSVWIDFLNGYESAHANRLAQAIAGGESIAVPGLVLTEVLLGLDSDAHKMHQSEVGDCCATIIWGNWARSSIIFSYWVSPSSSCSMFHA